MPHETRSNCLTVIAVGIRPIIAGQPEVTLNFWQAIRLTDEIALRNNSRPSSRNHHFADSERSFADLNEYPVTFQVLISYPIAYLDEGSLNYLFWARS
jgi:hypothetical protein